MAISLINCECDCGSLDCVICILNESENVRTNGQVQRESEIFKLQRIIPDAALPQ